MSDIAATQQGQKSQPTTQMSSADKAGAKYSEDYQNFLTLLTAQMENQNPLEPMDSSKFVSQLAQLSQVEQSVQTNQNLESIMSKLASQGSRGDVDLIGKTVTLESNTITTKGGPSDFQMSLSDSAETVKVQIKDADGNVVRTLRGAPTTTGTLHDMTWDGKDDTGTAVPQGTYNISVDAADAEGNSIGTSTFVETGVESVVFDGSSSLLSLANGATVPSSSVLAVS